MEFFVDTHQNARSINAGSAGMCKGVCLRYQILQSFVNSPVFFFFFVIIIFLMLMWVGVERNYESRKIWNVFISRMTLKSNDFLSFFSFYGIVLRRWGEGVLCSFHSMRVYSCGSNIRQTALHYKICKMSSGFYCVFQRKCWITIFYRRIMWVHWIFTMFAMSAYSERKNVFL